MTAARRRLLVPSFVLLAGCPVPGDDDGDTDVVDSEPVDSEVPAVTSWVSATAVDADLGTPFVALDVVAVDCADPTVVLTAADGAEQRVLEVTPVVDGDTLRVTAPVDALLPEGSTCALDRTLSVTAEVRCGDEVRPVPETRTLTVAVGASPINGLTGPARLFHRRAISAAYDDLVWATDGRAVVGTTLPGAGVARLVTLSDVDVTGAPLLRVRGDHHDFLAVRCTSRCPELSLGGGPLAGPGTVVSVPSAWVLAIPLDAPDGPLDAVARVAVPAGIVDLAFHDGTLTVLSQVGERALLARFPEKETLPTSAPLDAPFSVLPEPVGVAFQPGPEGDPLVVMRTSTDPTKAEPVFWDDIQQETVPVPTPSGGGGCANPGGTVIVSPSPNVSTSIPMSNGDEAGTATGTATGTGTTGCIKAVSMSVQVGALRASNGGGVATVSIDDWTAEVDVPGELIDGNVVDGVGARDQLIVAIAGDDGRVGLLRADLAGRAVAWLDFPGDAPDRPRRRVDLRHLATAADGAGVVVTTATGFHLFDGDGAWVAGTDGLSQACVSLDTPEVVAPAAGRLMAVLRTGPVLIPVP